MKGVSWIDEYEEVTGKSFYSNKYMRTGKGGKGKKRFWKEGLMPRVEHNKPHRWWKAREGEAAVSWERVVVPHSVVNE